MVTCEQAPGLAETTELFGSENVIVLGSDAVDLGSVRGALHQRGLTSVLCEGGPQLLTWLLAAGSVDELCVTVVPGLVGGEQPRIVGGPGVEQSLDLGVLLEERGTLLGRWFT